MDKKTEALKLALERLDTALSCDEDHEDGYYEGAIIAIREALAEQPAQQEQGDSNCKDADGCPTEKAVLQRFWRGEPIPTEHYPVWFKPAPVAEPAQQQEPVAWRYNGKLHEFDPSDWATGPVTPLYTSPPSLKALTEPEMAPAFRSSHAYTVGFQDGKAQALAWQTAQQEPVAWVVKMPGGYHDCEYYLDELNKVPHGTMLYAALPASKPLTDEQMAVLTFILGAGDLDGVWFGEQHPKEKGAFWWRNRLRNAFQDSAIEAANGATKENT